MVTEQPTETTLKHQKVTSPHLIQLGTNLLQQTTQALEACLVKTTRAENPAIHEGLTTLEAGESWAEEALERP